MRLFTVPAIILATFPTISLAQSDTNWSQREMERMQAQQERWDAQVERQRAQQERLERQQRQDARERDRRNADIPQHQPLPSKSEQTATISEQRLARIHTGNDLYGACTPDPSGNTTASNVQCFLYIGDVWLGQKVVKFEKAGGGSCYPEGVTLGQVKDIVFVYLRDTPTRRHVNATNLTVEAIVRAFPACHPIGVK